MASGCLVKLCPDCRGRKKPENHKCSRHKASYHAVVRYKANEKQKWKHAGRTKKKAKFFLEKWLDDIENGKDNKHKRVLFKDFALEWLENVPKPRVKPSTLRGYETDIRRHLTPYFGERFLDEINQEDVMRFIAMLIQKKGRGRDKCDKRLDAKTVNNVRLTLNMVLTHARKLKYISENPVADVEPLPVEKKEMEVLRPNEIMLALKQARGWFKVLLLTAVMTGMRRSELAAMQWGDIDWNSNMIFVRRSLYWRSKKTVPNGENRWIFVTPKSKRSIRAVVMSPKLKETLEIYRLTARYSPYDLVFSGETGGPQDMDNMYTREFLPTLSMAGIRRVRFHDLRHTYATLLIAQGENPKFIQSQMGHASIQMTMDTYGHLFPIDCEAVGDRLDKIVFGNPSNKNLTSVGQVLTNSAKEVGLEAVPGK